MKTYNIHEAKTHLSKIIHEVSEGETVYLAKAGKVVAEIKPYQEKRDRTFKFGMFKDKVWIADDWDSEEVNNMIADSFYQEDLMDPNSPDEVDGQVHPKYKEFFDKHK